MVICRSLPGTAPRSRRRRAGSWRCRQNGWPSGWHLTCPSVKRWQNAAMALRWTAAGMLEAAKGFRRLKAYRQLPILRAALVAHTAKHLVTTNVEPQADAA